MKFILIGLLLAGCASIHKSIELLQDPSSRVVTSQTPPLYARATKDLENERFAKARSEYEQFLNEQPTTPYTQVANFNLGRAYLGLDMIPEATEKFRFVAAQTTGHAPRLQAESLYQLSFCYEASGDKANVLASLLDSLQRKKYFSKEVGEAEIPARLAGAYAAIGNFDTAKEYYAQAENGIKNLKREYQKQNMPEWLPRTLYYMGDVSLRKISFDDITNLLRPLAKAQLYLLEAAELGSSSWSQKASAELIRTYQSGVEVIAQSKQSEDVGEAREAQAKQWQLAQDFYNVLDEMKTYEQPEEASQNLLAKNIFESVNESKRKLLDVLGKPKVGQELHEASEQRNSRRKNSLPKKIQKKPNDPNL